MNNKTLMIIGAIFVAFIAVLGFTAPVANPIDRAAAACKSSGKQLKSFKDTSSGVEFTCE